METSQIMTTTPSRREPRNTGKLVGQKPPFKCKEIGAFRVRLQLDLRERELALLDLAIDGNLRDCELVKLPVRDVRHGQTLAAPSIVLQHKIQRPAQFEITEPTGRQSSPGLTAPGCNRKTSSSPPASTPRCTCRRGSTRASWMGG